MQAHFVLRSETRVCQSDSQDQAHALYVYTSYVCRELRRVASNVSTVDWHADDSAVSAAKGVVHKAVMRTFMKSPMVEQVRSCSHAAAGSMREQR